MHPYSLALYTILAVGIGAWVYSVLRENVSVVDSLWSLFFLLAAMVFAASAPALSDRGVIVLVLVAIWALRLSLYITSRNFGEEEDYRYRSIRSNNEPGFALKSLYIVFGLQGVLAWLVALPLLPAITADVPLGLLDVMALSLWLVGFVFEAGGDYQLSRFRKDPQNAGRVLDTGFWRFTRHPNYFGDFCIWWAYYLFAVSAGGWWSVASPILMSLLLLKVSGVAMLERTISERRPKYLEYIETTNAFFPGPGRKRAAAVEDMR